MNGIPASHEATTGASQGVGPVARLQAAQAVRRRPRRAGWWLVAAIALAAALPIGWQQLDQATLRIEADLLRDQVRDLGALQTANAELLHKQAPPEEVLMLRADRLALERMRAELEDIRGRAESSTTSPANPAPVRPLRPARSMLEMRNVGRATPAAAGETFIWALQSGDIDTAAGLMTFQPKTRTRMEAILADMPESFRGEYPTPEKFMAFVMAGSRGAAAVRLLDEQSRGDIAVQVLELEIGDGRTRQDSILFQYDGEGWRRVISPKAVEMLAAYLKEYHR